MLAIFGVRAFQVNCEKNPGILADFKSRDPGIPLGPAHIYWQFSVKGTKFGFQTWNWFGISGPRRRLVVPATETQIKTTRSQLFQHSPPHPGLIRYFLARCSIPHPTQRSIPSHILTRPLIAPRCYIHLRRVINHIITRKIHKNHNKRQNNTSFCLF